jgi:glycosyltransferase involved in cell wall biosynthesis
MDLALIVPGPLDTVSGGYEYDRRIVAGLRAAGHGVQVIVLADSPDAARTALPRIADGVRPLIDGLSLPAFAGQEGALATRGAAGLIHHPVSLETGLSNSETAALRATEQHLFGRLSRVVVTSETTAELLVADFAVDRARIRIVVPGTDEAPRSTGSVGATCRILSVGALVPRKGHDLLLRALARLFDLDWQLTVVGSMQRDPVHARTLAALAEELGIARRVSLAGELDGPSLEPLWRDADLFALATHWEGYGMAVAEALKRGVPVAVTEGGAVGRLVTAEAGVVVPAGDHTNLSKALRRLIFDRVLRRAMAQAAWQVGRTLPGWQSQAREFAQALTE